MCAACSATDWRMVPTLPAEFEIRRRISRIADSSLASRAASDSWLAADELRGRVVSARLRPFRVAAFRRRDLIDAAPALERRLIALPWLNKHIIAVSAVLCITANLAAQCPLWVMCGRRLIDKSFLTLMQHWSGAVMCPAC